MYSEDDLLALSGLQCLLFCGRQRGLIHVEQIWELVYMPCHNKILPLAISVLSHLPGKLGGSRLNETVLFLWLSRRGSLPAR